MIEEERYFREEGPILLTLSKVRGASVAQELGEKVKQLREDGVISEDAKILLISGTHGTEDGKSALTEASLSCHCFYKEDCKLFAIEAGPRRVAENLPITDFGWEILPDITKPAERIKIPATACHQVMERMDIRVLNITYYHLQGDKLRANIEQEGSTKDEKKN